MIEFYECLFLSSSSQNGIVRILEIFLPNHSNDESQSFYGGFKGTASFDTSTYCTCERSKLISCSPQGYISDCGVSISGQHHHLYCLLSLSFTVPKTDLEKSIKTLSELEQDAFNSQP